MTSYLEVFRPDPELRRILCGLARPGEVDGVLDNPHRVHGPVQVGVHMDLQIKLIVQYGNLPLSPDLKNQRSLPNVLAFLRKEA